MAINWIAPHGNFSKTLSLDFFIALDFIAVVCQVFQALYREWVLTESLLSAWPWKWEWNAFWRKKSVCNFIQHKNTQIYYKYDSKGRKDDCMVLLHMLLSDMFRTDTRYWLYVKIYYILCSTFCCLESRHYFRINISVMQ